MASEDPWGSADPESLFRFTVRAKREVNELVGTYAPKQTDEEKIASAADKMRAFGLDPAESIVYIEVARFEAEDKASREGEEFSTDYALLIAFLLGVQRGRMNKAEEVEVVDAGT